VSKTELRCIEKDVLYRLTMSLASQIPDSPMWQLEPYKEPWEQMEAGFYLHADSLPPQPPNAQEVWQMSPDFHGLAGLMEPPPLELPAAELDPLTAALIKDAEAKLKLAKDKLSAYQVKIAEKRSHKSKAIQAKELLELTKVVDRAQRWLTMVSAY
jgi:hypothetical protein